MDEIEFILNGSRKRLTREQVINAMRKQTPGVVQTWGVEVDGTVFPVKQVLAQALQVPRTDFISTRAQDLLGKLGFKILNTEAGGEEASSRPAASGPGGRLDALHEAIAFAQGRDMSAADVLDAAQQFADWLDS